MRALEISINPVFLHKIPVNPLYICVLRGFLKAGKGRIPLPAPVVAKVTQAQVKMGVWERFVSPFFIGGKERNEKDLVSWNSYCRFNHLC